MKRLKTRHQDDIRAKIKSDRLINWLQAGIFEEKFQGIDPRMDGPRVRAAIALLNKTLPDLSQSETNHSGSFELTAPWMQALAKKRGWA